VNGLAPQFFIPISVTDISLLIPAQDYDYGYRQGVLQDPYGHQWLIQMNI
jgi:uncharacterized glyoxalase superfamily protein PhnB